MLRALHTEIFELNWKVFSDKVFVFKTIYPNLFADSSIISLRFSFKDMSMELNFCFTCFKGKLKAEGKKNTLTGIPEETNILPSFHNTFLILDYLAS